MIHSLTITGNILVVDASSCVIGDHVAIGMTEGTIEGVAMFKNIVIEMPLQPTHNGRPREALAKRPLQSINRCKQLGTMVLLSVYEE